MGQPNPTIIKIIHFDPLHIATLEIYLLTSVEEFQKVFLEYAGRSAKEANLYTEVSEGIFSYGITRHRHGQCFVPKQDTSMIPCNFFVYKQMLLSL